jgi:septum formation protein
MLLRDAGFDFVVLSQDCDEHACSNSPNACILVQELARAKMNHTQTPLPELLSEHELANGIFVITADSVVEDCNGNIHGKPIDHADALKKIANLRTGVHVHTAFCLEKWLFDEQNNIWTKGVESIVVHDKAFCVMDISPEWAEWYLKHHSIAYRCAGAMAVEGIGGLFGKRIEGSCSTLIGLPLCALREQLAVRGFFE